MKPDASITAGRAGFIEPGRAHMAAPQAPADPITETAAAMAAATLDAPMHRWSAGLPGIDPQRDYDDATRAALLRLHASRLGLVAVLIPEPPAARPHGMATLRPAAWWRWLRGQMRRSPVFSVVSDGLLQVWRHHPWRPAATALSDTLSPAVRQYPWVAVALSAGIGAAVVAARPWQWSLLAPHIAAAPRQARHWAFNELTQRLTPTSGLQGLLVTAIGSGLAQQLAAAWSGPRAATAAAGPARGPDVTPDPQRASPSTS